MAKTVTVSVEFDAQKYQALVAFAEQKNIDVSAELTKNLEKIYQRIVPATVKKYLDNISGPKE